eukprot:TRINITY_DN11324_c0_g1_i1.p2 TRINITY_DN11324_c0_g1~~TRINITY_DN11324_c0_g1_i1.p2  ORF type:complete len:165 (-),score=35.79 TRINITY_DN11324_c0_g1_i1:20-514(-)
MLKRSNIMDYSLLVGIHHHTLDKPAKPTFRGSSLTKSEQELFIDQEERETRKSEESESDMSQEDSPEMLVADQPLPSVLENDQISIFSDQKHNNYSSFSRLRSEDGTKTYFIGVIDILQEWNFSKRFERWVKVFFKFEDGDGISAVNPERYSDRFLTRISEFVQ